MGLITTTLPTSGQPRGSEEIDVLNSLTTIVNAINGGLDTNNLNASAGITAAQLATAIVQAAGINSGATTRRGKSIVATQESRSSTSYGLLTTPDRVSSVVLPTDGLMCIAFQAMWQNSVASAGRAAIFIGSNQLKANNSGIDATAPSVQEGNGSSVANTYSPLATYSGGLNSVSPSSAYLGDVTTGQALGANSQAINAAHGGVCYVFAAAGTYDISVQFKSSSGSVTVKNRNLWVWTLGF